MRRAKFFADDKTRDATLHCLLRISEAAAKLGKTAEELAPDQSWRQICDLGNRLRHEYDAIDRDRIWVIVSDELALLGRLRQAIESLQPSQRPVLPLVQLRGYIAGARVPLPECRL